MKKIALEALLARLIARWEGEVVEFKQAGNDYDTDKIGRYFSAMANEAKLRFEDGAWLVRKFANRDAIGWHDHKCGISKSAFDLAPEKRTP